MATMKLADDDHPIGLAELVRRNRCIWGISGEVWREGPDGRIVCEQVREDRIGVGLESYWEARAVELLTE